MQQPPQMISMVPSFPPTNITTEQIQKYLDENKKLIMAILENQNLGKLAECAQYQALLQKNLMYLAAIADAQPQAPASAPAPSVAQQMAPHPAMQPPAYFMQHPQAGGAMPHQAPPPGIFPPRGPLQFNSPHQLQDPEQHQQQQQQQQQQQLHQQAMQGHMGIRPMAINNNGLQQAMHHPETALGTGGSVGPNDARGGSKQDGSDAGQSGTDGHGSSAARHGGGDGKDDVK